MPGTKLGGQHAAATNIQRHGPDFYSKIGTKGGRTKGAPKGFAAVKGLAQRAGSLSKRRPKVDKL